MDKKNQKKYKEIFESKEFQKQLLDNHNEKSDDIDFSSWCHKIKEFSKRIKSCIKNK
jgi:hypothetical protein